MIDTAEHGGDEPLPALRAAIDTLLAAPLHRASTAELRALLRGLHTEHTRLQMTSLAVITELHSRPEPGNGSPNPLRDTLQTGLTLDRRDAVRLMTDAAELTARPRITGPASPPAFRHVAAALTAGQISFTHARIIRDCLHRLPAAARALPPPTGSPSAASETGGPADQTVSQAEAIETTLTEHARTLPPHALRQLAARITALLDPDGPPPDDDVDDVDDVDDRQHRQRRLIWQQHPDGTVHGRFVLTAPAAAVWATILTALNGRHEASDNHTSSRADDHGAGNGSPSDGDTGGLHAGPGPDSGPAPGDGHTGPGDGHTGPGPGLGPDTRTRQQRDHDALAEAGRRLLRSRTLPDHAGLPTTLIITATTTDLPALGLGPIPLPPAHAPASGGSAGPAGSPGSAGSPGPAGSAAEQVPRRPVLPRTPHGITLTAGQARDLATDPTVLAVALNPTGGLQDHGRERRLATRRQRLALIARDRGCTFPGCTTPAADTEAHHLTPWADGGPTNLTNLALACGYHNNEAPRLGWTSALDHHGIPHWTAPPWLDPTQTPRRNYQHHPELLTPPHAAGPGTRAAERGPG